jgi:hypothetical protein
MSLRALNKLCQLPVCNLKDKKRQIATHFITENKYTLA